jgi:hypothetical protein
MTDKKSAAAGPPKAPAGGITKIEAVQRALSELGHNAQLGQMQAHIKERFGIEMSTDHIRTSRSVLFKRRAAHAKAAATKAGVTNPAVAKPAAAKSPAQPSAARKQGPKKPTAQPQSQASLAHPVNGPAAGISLDDIESVKALLERVGAPSLRRLIDVMAK